MAPARVTNLALFAALLMAFATGVGAVATGSARGAWVVIGHGLAGVIVVLLIPAKSCIAKHATRRPTGWLSYGLAGLAVAALLTGLGSGTGLVRSIGGSEALWWHIAIALALVPLLLWHLVARPARPRRTDLSRRNLLRAGTVAGVGIAAYAALGGAVTAAGLPGARRRFTGSHEVGSFAPHRMPTTIWLDDTVPRVDPTAWRLSIVDGSGTRTLRLDQVPAATTVRAVLDCTSGWYAEQDWTGVPLSALIGDPGTARSLVVRSATGYAVRFPVRDLDRLLLATRVGDRPLSSGHGAPLRLVAPGRRGFWWVKWVTHLELSPTPWWWQPPFPVT